MVSSRARASGSTGSWKVRLIVSRLAIPSGWSSGAVCSGSGSRGTSVTERLPAAMLNSAQWSPRLGRTELQHPRPQPAPGAGLRRGQGDKTLRMVFRTGLRRAGVGRKEHGDRVPAPQEMVRHHQRPIRALHLIEHGAAPPARARHGRTRRAMSSSQGSRGKQGKARGFAPDPTRGLCPLDSRQGRSPWNPSLGAVGREGAQRSPLPSWIGDRRSSRSWRAQAPSRPTAPNGWIAKALPLLGVQGAKPLDGFRAEPWPCLLLPAALGACSSPCGSPVPQRALSGGAKPAASSRPRTTSGGGGLGCGTMPSTAGRTKRGRRIRRHARLQQVMAGRELPQHRDASCQRLAMLVEQAHGHPVRIGADAQPDRPGGGDGEAEHGGASGWHRHRRADALAYLRPPGVPDSSSEPDSGPSCGDRTCEGAFRRPGR